MKTAVYHLTTLLCVLLTPFASQAAFNPIPGHVYEIRNRYSAQSLEVGGSNRYADGHGVNLWSYWGGANQQWSFERIGTTGSDYKIYNRNSRQPLQMDGSLQAINDRVARVWQSWANSDNVWNIVELPGGALTISRRYFLPGASTTSVFLLRTDAPWGNFGTTYTGDKSVVTSPNEDDYPDKFKWDIEDRSATTSGVFRIVNASSGKVLSAGEDNSVTQLTMWYLASQQWTFSDYNADNYLSIINRNTGQVLEIGGGSQGQAGARANVWDGWEHHWQQWRLLDANNQLRTLQDISTTGIPCKLVNRASGLVLEIGGGGDLSREGLAANQWYDFNGLNQQWYIYFDSSYRGPAKSGDAASSDPASGTLTLYPNPASTTLQITFPGNSEALQVTITDAHGRAVQVSHYHGKVDVSNLAPGLYVVSATDGQKTFRQKFVKE